MNWTTVFFIVLAVGLITSPVMALMPSRRQRLLAKMRTHASSLGLQVRLVDFSTADNHTEFKSLACYSLPWTASEISAAKKLTSWQLVKGEMDHEIHFTGLWDWAKPEYKAPEGWHRQLKAVIESASNDALFAQIKVLEQSPQGFHVYWGEKAEVESVDKIAFFLNGLKVFALQQSDSFSWPLTNQASSVNQ